MRRHPPIVREGRWYHAIGRSRGRDAVFARAADRAAFLDRLAAAARTLPVEVHAYCVMGTHYHLFLRAPEPRCREAIRRVEGPLADRLGRTRTIPLDLGRHFLDLTRYLHLNPVAAGLVVRASDWPWSSYRGYVDGLAGPDWLRTSAVLGWLGCIAPRALYREYVERAA